MTGELSVSAVQMKIHALFNLVKSPFYVVHFLKVREDNKSIKRKRNDVINYEANKLSVKIT